MKVVVGIFPPDQMDAAVHHLLRNGYSIQDLAIIYTAADIPDNLQEESEKAALNGSVVGAAAGGALGALGGLAISTLPGMEATAMYGLMATATGSAIGTYLGSIYNERDESQAAMDIREALAVGDTALAVQTGDEAAQSAADLLVEAGGKVEIHPVISEDANLEDG